MYQAKGFQLINQVLYLAFFTSLIFSLRAAGSISIALIIIAGLIKNKLETTSFFHQHIKNSFLASCFLLFAIHLISLLYTQNIKEGWNDVRLASGLLFIPLGICCTGYINTDIRQKLLLQYCLILFTASLYCLCLTLIHYFQSGDSSTLFYHALVRPLKHHAVYYSILVVIALLFLSEELTKKSTLNRKHLCISGIIFFSIFLFLLSSKLVLGFYILYLLYYLTRLIKAKAANRVRITGLLILFILAGSLTLTTTNPVSERFYDITKGDLRVINREKFDPGMYFNGLQFRLLQWKFTAEILNENRSWLTGISPGDAQHYLDQKYISAKMYTGDPIKGDKGFLGYNTHNQFLETVLQTGLAGLVTLFVVCFSLVRIGWRKKKRLLSAVVILLLAWLFTESVLETQSGIMIFTFFPLFLSFD